MQFSWQLVHTCTIRAFNVFLLLAFKSTTRTFPSLIYCIITSSSEALVRFASPPPSLSPLLSLRFVRALFQDLSSETAHCHVYNSSSRTKKAVLTCTFPLHLRQILVPLWNSKLRDLCDHIKVSHTHRALTKVNNHKRLNFLKRHLPIFSTT